MSGVEELSTKLAKEMVIGEPKKKAAPVPPSPASKTSITPSRTTATSQRQSRVSNGTPNPNSSRSSTPVRRTTESSTSVPDFDACVRNFKPKTAEEIYKDSPKPGSSKKYAHVKSRVGSLDNAKHSPTGGDKKIITQKVDFSYVSPKIGSLDNTKHKPGGGNVKIVSKTPDFSKVQAKIGSLENSKHKPGGGDVKVITQTPDFSKVKSKIGSIPERSSSVASNKSNSSAVNTPRKGDTGAAEDASR